MTPEERKHMEEMARLHRQDPNYQFQPKEPEPAQGSTLTNPANHPGLEGEFKGRITNQKRKMIADMLRGKSDHPF
jgi:hypothetical protein